MGSWCDPTLGVKNLEELSNRKGKLAETFEEVQGPRTAVGLTKMINCVITSLNKYRCFRSDHSCLWFHTFCYLLRREVRWHNRHCWKYGRSRARLWSSCIVSIFINRLKMQTNCWKLKQKLALFFFLLCLSLSFESQHALCSLTYVRCTNQQFTGIRNVYHNLETTFTS